MSKPATALKEVNCVYFNRHITGGECIEYCVNDKTIRTTACFGKDCQSPFKSLAEDKILEKAGLVEKTKGGHMEKRGYTRKEAVMINVSKISQLPKNIGRQFRGLDNLVADIKINTYEPIRVKADGNGNFTVSTDPSSRNERLLEAAKLAELSEIKAIISKTRAATKLAGGIKQKRKYIKTGTSKPAAKSAEANEEKAEQKTAIAEVGNNGLGLFGLNASPDAFEERVRNTFAGILEQCAGRCDEYAEKFRKISKEVKQ